MPHLYWLFELAGCTDNYFTAERLFSIPEREIINTTLSSDVLWVRFFPLSSNLPPPGIINISHLSLLSKVTIFNLKGFFFSLSNFLSVQCRWKLLYECKFHSFIQSFYPAPAFDKYDKTCFRDSQEADWFHLKFNGYLELHEKFCRTKPFNRKEIHHWQFQLCFNTRQWGFLLRCFTKDQIFIYESQKYVCFTSAVTFRQKETLISISFNK